MDGIRDPTIEPVTPHPDSLRRIEASKRSGRRQGWRFAGYVMAAILTVNVGVIVAVGLGSPARQGPAEAAVVARWNAAAGADLQLAPDAPLCTRGGVTVAETVTLNARCSRQHVGELLVAVNRGAGRSQEILDILTAVFDAPASFVQTANGLTFDVSISSPTLRSLDGDPAGDPGDDYFYERPLVMYGTSLVAIVAVHLLAMAWRSRGGRILFAVSLAAWGLVLVLDIQGLHSGRVLGALAAVTFASAAFNLLALASQQPVRAPFGLGIIDLRPRPHEIDLTLEPPPAPSPRWGGGRRGTPEPPRIL